VICVAAIIDVMLAFVGPGFTLLACAAGAILTFLGARHP
jgi:hypothetical protein